MILYSVRRVRRTKALSQKDRGGHRFRPLLGARHLWPPPSASVMIAPIRSGRSWGWVATVALSSTCHKVNWPLLLGQLLSGKPTMRRQTKATAHVAVQCAYTALLLVRPLLHFTCWPWTSADCRVAWHRKSRCASHRRGDLIQVIFFAFRCLPIPTLLFTPW